MLLVRHASAGDRENWEGDDALRPLDARGRAQADSLPALLAGFEVVRILSSPAVRCVATVEPLARARDLAVEIRDELSEAHQAAAGAALVREVAGLQVVVCGHGGREAAALEEPPRWHKGEAFVVGAGLRVVEALRP